MSQQTSTKADDEAVTTADKSRIRAFLIEEDLAEIQEAIADSDSGLGEDEAEVLERVNTRLLNIQRTITGIKKNVTDNGTTRT